MGPLQTVYKQTLSVSAYIVVLSLSPYKLFKCIQSSIASHLFSFFNRSDQLYTLGLLKLKDKIYCPPASNLYTIYTNEQCHHIYSHQLVVLSLVEGIKSAMYFHMSFLVKYTHGCIISQYIEQHQL